MTSKTGFDLDASGGHDFRHAHYLATACNLAYLPADEGRHAYEQTLRLNAELISVDNTQAYLGTTDNAIVVAFRGSEALTSIDGVKDWLLTNARNFLVLPEGRIGTDFAAAGVGARFHRGFMDALAEIWAPLFRRVEQTVGEKGRPIWVTGHSLGGALALLFAWRLHQNFLTVHQVCTFGAPMIGNAAAADAFQREFRGNIYRYVDYRDLVPRLPTVSLLSNEYVHCEQEVIVGNKDATTSQQIIESLATTVANANPTSGLTTNLINLIWGELSEGMPSHLMGNYLERLSDHLNQ